MLRMATGPWSPWIIREFSGASGMSMWARVGPSTSTFSWTMMPLWKTRKYFAFAIFLPEASKRGAWNQIW